ncbi:MAG: chemotaxis-specific protein-glutamate methyltransferase CheB [Myxococcota bacterium]|nr:chemotaxis-specific protein-glutamate methyltransferase CheB [Myxococcota bacterium]
MTAAPLRVVVVDDSAAHRRALTELLEDIDGVHVVARAADGDEALQRCFELRPDLVTLDLEMPRMDGFTFLRLLMARQPTPVLVVSGRSGRQDVFRALELGALDFVARPAGAGVAELDAMRADLRAKVELVRQLSPAAGLRGASHTVTGRFAVVGASARAVPQPGVAIEPSRLVVVGASTGGPSALVELFAALPSSSRLCIVVAQHMPERFTRSFAERLDRLGGVRVREARDGEPIVAGTGLVCPGGRVASVERGPAGSLRLRTAEPDSSDRYVPSVDRLFRSAAACVGPRLVAVVLTGMGDDGARGVHAVADAGGLVIAESERSAVVHGMPGAALRTGRVHRCLTLHEIIAEIAALDG